MKKILSTTDQAAIAIVRQLLRQEGIKSRVLNQNAAAALGEIPFLHASPEVWVADEDAVAAKAIVHKFDSGELRESMAGPDWTCPDCNELIDGQFTECWNCADENEASGEV